MLKRDELARPGSCINRAEDDEPVFVLLGRDAVAPEAVRHWAMNRVYMQKNKHSDPQIVEALALADAMEIYRMQHR